MSILNKAMARAVAEQEVRAFFEDRGMAIPTNPQWWIEHVEVDDSHESVVRAALAEADKRGYVLVPKEPTEAMMDAGEGCNRQYIMRAAQRADVWFKMLAARPQIESEDK